MLIRTIGLSALVLSVGMIVHSPVSAQPSTADSLKKLEADVKKLRDQLKELEGKLSKAGGKTESGPMGLIGKKPDPEKMKEMFKKWTEWKKDPEKMKEMFKKWAEAWKKKAGEAKKGEHSKGKGRYMARGGRGWYRGRGASSRSVEARIDHIIRELEDLRRQLKKR